MAIRIRPITPDDVEVLIRWLPRTDSGVYGRRIEQQRRGEGIYLVAWEDELPVGHLMLRWLAREGDGPTSATGRPHLVDVGVRPDHQGRGAGTALIGRAETIATGAGHRSVGLSVGVENHAARRLYERLGYRETDDGPFPVWWMVPEPDGTERVEEEVCLYMVKELGLPSKE